MGLLKNLMRHRMGRSRYKHLEDDHRRLRQSSADRPLLKKNFADSSGRISSNKVSLSELMVAKKKGHPGQKQTSTDKSTTTELTMETSHAASFDSRSGRLSPANSDPYQQQDEEPQETLDMSDLIDDTSNGEIPHLMSPQPRRQNNDNIFRKQKRFTFEKGVSMPSLHQGKDARSQLGVATSKASTGFDSQESKISRWTNPEKCSDRMHQQDKHRVDILRAPVDPFHYEHNTETTTPKLNSLKSPVGDRSTREEKSIERSAISTQNSRVAKLKEKMRRLERDRCTHEEDSIERCSASTENTRVAELKEKLRILERNYRQRSAGPQRQVDVMTSICEGKSYSEGALNQALHQEFTGNDRAQDNEASDDESYISIIGEEQSCDISDITENTSPSLNPEEFVRLIKSEIRRDDDVLAIMQRLREVFAVGEVTSENEEKLVHLMDCIDSGVRGEI